MVRKEIGALLVAAILVLLAWLLPILFPTLEARTGYKFLAGLIIAGLLASIWVIWPVPEKIEEENVLNGDDNRIQIGSVIGNQNRVGHEIHHHHRPVQRHLTSELSREVEEKITGDKPIRVSYPSGDHETQMLANELHAYLAAQGYEMESNEAGWFMGNNPGPNMVNISPFNNGEIWHINLGPAA